MQESDGLIPVSIGNSYKTVRPDQIGFLRRIHGSNLVEYPTMDAYEKARSENSGKPAKNQAYFAGSDFSGF